MTTPATDQIPLRPDGLQLDEDRPFQRKLWRAQRLLWASFAFVLLLAALGLTGRGGWLGQRLVQIESGTVTFPRIARRDAPETLPVTFTQDQTFHELFLGTAFLRDFRIETVTPAPRSQMQTQDGVILRFAADGPAPHHLFLHVSPQTAGLTRFYLALDGLPVSASVLTLP